MRRAAKVDRNHAEIVAALERMGCTVQSLAQVGRGCPDLLAGFRGRNLCIEVKDGAKAPSRRQLTADEARWHAAWRGQIATVASVDEAIALVQSLGVYS